MIIPLGWKIIIAAVIVALLVTTIRTIISLLNKNERLRKREERAIEAAVESTRIINLLSSGDGMYMDQQERMMVLSALEYVPFREAIELPETKHHIRQVYRRVREKIQILIKKEENEAREILEAEVEEDDETKEAPK